MAQVGTHIFYKLSPYRVQVAAREPTKAEKVVLISGAAGLPADVNVAPELVETAIEASLRPASDMRTKPAPASAPAPKPTEAAALAAPQSATVSTS